MKRKLLIDIATFTIAALNINMNNTKTQPSALSLTNVDALADESGGNPCNVCFHGGNYLCCNLAGHFIVNNYT